ncbi:hypothetical protein VTJ83DRAFT_3070 [Remersonia thermophila]|uniref:Major facilitator superfamily (MFS) profile domain-containing protein n=1 Tax=Remersonia thermophila TaxID=72144 RepID=A0ABR4DD02_9PEZI
MSWNRCTCVSKLLWSLPELEDPACPVHHHNPSNSKMVHGEANETSPLLDHRDANLKGKGKADDYHISISEISPSGSLNGDSNGDFVKKSFGSDDEESVGQGELQPVRQPNVVRIILVLLIGILIGNADGSILLATHPVIASEFNDLANSSWLITGFGLAGAATQTLYGKLSDIYGRKLLVLVAYTIFVIGTFIVAAGQTMWQVILGRVISGAGASGMAGLVSILITDFFPIRDVAAWRAYVNLVATLGRSIGGPLGGWLVDVIGWRWSFYGQIPPIILAIFLVQIYLPGPSPASSSSSPPGSPGFDAAADGASPSSSTTPSRANSICSTTSSKLGRVDFKGSILLALTILAFLLPVELGGGRLSWTHPLVLGLFLLSPVLLYWFIGVEKRQPEPILPLEIFQLRDAVISYLILGLQTGAQVGLMFSVPLYFRITAGTSNTESGAHLVPAVVGNALGGLLSGVFIKRSGRYKGLIVLAVTASSLSYLLLMLRWHGRTNLWESLYIFPGGFGTGVAQSAVFVSLQAAIADPAHLAPAISFMYLSTTLAVTLGLPIVNAVLQSFLEKSLVRRLVALGLGRREIAKVIESTLSDVDFVDRVTGPVREAVVGSYVDGLWWSHGVSFLFSATAFVLALGIRQRRLEGGR